LNPFITEAQKKWFETFGRANAAEFDKRGFGYFVRETYDSFYPGYGESWPIFHGSIGMTFEQASPRGLAFRREDGSTLTYRDAVTHHFTAAITTAATAAKNRERLLRDFLEYRRSATALAQKGTREYVLVPGKDPARARRLAAILTAQGIIVKQAEEAFQAGSQQLPKGTFIVPLAQPAARLARNLLDPDVKMDDAFIKEQDRRRKARLNDQIYDVTAWSLPLMYDVEIISNEKSSSVRTTDFPPNGDGPAPSVQPVPSGTVTQVSARDGVRPPGRTTGGGGRTAAADRRAPWHRADSDFDDVDRGRHFARQRTHRLSEDAASTARLGCTRLQPFSRLGALYPGAAFRPARHRDADVDVAELRHEGLRRPRSAVGHLQHQRRRVAAIEGLDPQRRNARDAR
jgi:hypothetical protein